MVDILALAANAVTIAMDTVAIPATWIPAAGAKMAVRVVPIDEQPLLHPSSTLPSRVTITAGDGRSFLVDSRDFAGRKPESGDHIVVTGETWRVRSTKQETPVAPMWRLYCQMA